MRPSTPMQISITLCSAISCRTLSRVDVLRGAVVDDAQHLAPAFAQPQDLCRRRDGDLARMFAADAVDADRADEFRQLRIAKAQFTAAFLNTRQLGRRTEQ